MDSITQIVLGAAAGEVVLGKKIGNRAMLWGAVAGTIPDLDVIGNTFMSQIDALAFHRGISHSFLFSIVGAFVFGWLVYRMYESRYHKYIGMLGWLIFSLSIASLIMFAGKFTIVKGLIALIVAIGGCYLIYQRFNRPSYTKPTADLKDWQQLFFWGLVTHPILDTFTAYGTQLFAPFSDYRAAISNISVADPLYTLLFAIPLIIAAFINRKKPSRRKWVYLGIFLSSMYMCFTLFNKYRISKVMKHTLEAEHIEYSRFFTSPSILNNILWSGVAETEDAYYQGQYSFFDKEPKFKLSKINKNYDLLQAEVDQDKVLRTLSWFSSGYYTVLKRTDGKLQINDMRYGTFRGEGKSEEDFIFNFPIELQQDGTYKLIRTQGGPREGTDMGQMASDLWTRIMGI